MHGGGGGGFLPERPSISLIIVVVIIIIGGNGLTPSIDRSIDGMELDLQVRPLHYHHHYGTID